MWNDVCQIRRPVRLVDGFRPSGVFAHAGGPIHLLASCSDSFLLDLVLIVNASGYLLSMRALLLSTTLVALLPDSGRAAKRPSASPFGEPDSNHSFYFGSPLLALGFLSKPRRERRHCL